MQGVLSRQGESVHLFQRHSPRTCRIPPERGYLLVQSAASLQRFALVVTRRASVFPPTRGKENCPTGHQGKVLFTMILIPARHYHGIKVAGKSVSAFVPDPLPVYAKTPSVLLSSPLVHMMQAAQDRFRDEIRG